MPIQVRRAANDPGVLRELALRNKKRRIVETESEYSSEEDAPDAPDCIEVEAEAEEDYSDSDSDSDVGSEGDSDRKFGCERLTDRNTLSAAPRRVQYTDGDTSVSRAQNLGDWTTRSPKRVRTTSYVWQTTASAVRRIRHRVQSRRTTARSVNCHFQLCTIEVST